MSTSQYTIINWCGGDPCDPCNPDSGPYHITIPIVFTDAWNYTEDAGLYTWVYSGDSSGPSGYPYTGDWTALAGYIGPAPPSAYLAKTFSGSVPVNVNGKEAGSIPLGGSGSATTNPGNDPTLPDYNVAQPSSYAQVSIFGFHAPTTAFPNEWAWVETRRLYYYWKNHIALPGGDVTLTITPPVPAKTDPLIMPGGPQFNIQTGSLLRSKMGHHLPLIRRFQSK